MASPRVDLGNGTTIVFGTSGFTAELKTIKGINPTRESVPTSHLGTTEAGAGEVGGMTFIPADLTDGGTITIGGHFNPDTVPPIEADAEAITITYPSGATAAFSGFMTNYDVQDAEVNVVTEFTAELKVSGVITITAAE